MNPSFFSAGSGRILTVGDGDLSFSESLLSSLEDGSRLTATVYDTYQTVTEKYEGATERIEGLRKRGATVLFGVDARNLGESVGVKAKNRGGSTSTSTSSSSTTSSTTCTTTTSITTTSTTTSITTTSTHVEKFSRIVFQFPLLPAMSRAEFESAPSPDPVVNNRLMLLEFLAEAMDGLLDRERGIAVITSKDVRPYTLWRLHDKLHEELNAEYATGATGVYTVGALPTTIATSISSPSTSSTCSSSGNTSPSPSSTTCPVDEEKAKADPLQYVHFLGKLPFAVEDFPGYQFQNVDRDKRVKDTGGVSFLFCHGGATKNLVQESTCSSRNASTDQEEAKKANAVSSLLQSCDRCDAPGLCRACLVGPFTSENDREAHVTSKAHLRFVSSDKVWSRVVEEMWSQRRRKRTSSARTRSTTEQPSSSTNKRSSAEANEENDGSSSSKKRIS